jgi:phosphoribosylformylglycinamidine synthase subunit PurL
MKTGDALVLIGQTQGQLGQSMYLREVLGREDGAPPPVDLAVERRTGDLVRAAIESGQIRTVHDLSDGGLIAAAAEMALASGVGVQLRAPDDLPVHGFLFGEDQARYLIATPAPSALLAACEAAGLPARIVGEAGGEEIAVLGLVSLPLQRLSEAHEAWLPRYMAG